MRDRKHKNKTYDISTRNIDNDFMTNDELKVLYKELRRHMAIIYKNIDEDVIQMTIIRGLYSTHSYKKEKSSKLVWFQTILRNIYLYNNAPEYGNKLLRNVSMDKPLNDDDNRNLIDTLILTEELYEEDNENYFKMMDILENGNYQVLRQISKGYKVKDIADTMGLTTTQIYTKLKKETKRFEDDIKNNKMEFVLKNRVNIKRKKSKRLYQFDENGIPYRDCKVCGVRFNFDPTAESGVKCCSPKCKLENDKMYMKEYNLKMRLKRKKQNN